MSVKFPSSVHVMCRYSSCWRRQLVVKFTETGGAGWIDQIMPLLLMVNEMLYKSDINTLLRIFVLIKGGGGVR